jgi:hypothetical protein
MLDSLSKWSIPLYGETSNQIWLVFFAFLWEGIYMAVPLYDNLTSTLVYPHFWKILNTYIS